MATVGNVNEILDGHIVLDLECLDRVYLNAYVPKLQVSGQVVSHRPLAYRRGQTQQFLPLALNLADVDAVADQRLQGGIGRGLLERVQAFVGEIADAGRITKAEQLADPENLVTECPVSE